MRAMVEVTISVEGSHRICVRPRKFVTVITHSTSPSAGLVPRVTPMRGQDGDKMGHVPGVCDRR
jgi:hypothetical protein